MNDTHKSVVPRDVGELLRVTTLLTESQRLAKLGSWEWIPDIDVPYWSPEMFRIFGADPSKGPLNYIEVSQRYHPDDWKRLSEAVELTARTGETYELECRIKRVDGLDRWVVCRGEGVKDQEGRIINLRGTVQDITSRKSLEEMHRFDAERLSLAIAATNAGVWDAETPFEVITTSDRLREVWCLAPDVPVTREALLNAIHPEDRGGVMDNVRRALSPAGDGRFRFEHRIVTPAGKTRWVSSWGLTVFSDSEAGRVPIRSIGIVHDITERKEATELRDNAQRIQNEANLQRLADRLQLATRIGHIGIWDWDIPNDQITWDDEMFRLYGLRHDQGHIPYRVWSEAVHVDDRERANREIQEAVAGRKAFDTEFRVTWPDGAVHHIRASAIVQFDEAGKAVRMVGTNQDITASKLATATLAEAHAQLLSANRELSAFSYSVSHDLRAPLRGIDGWSQALLEDYSDQLDARAREYLDRVRSETQRMGQLIDDMLKLSRVSQAEMKPECVDLSAMVRQISARLQDRDPHRRVEWIIEPDLRVKADPGLLRAAVGNLIENAWKFTSKREIAKIEFGCNVEDGERIFFVRDNGAGFNMAYADKLFSAFQRLHKMSEFPGTGIGLATVYRVMHRHGGRIWAEAQEDCGATFHFVLEP